MKSYLLNLGVLVALALMSSCGDDPLPAATANFSYTTESGHAPEVGMSIEFNNESTNFETVIWDFGNGYVTDSLSPSVIYEESDEYIVTLIAKTADGQETVTSKDLKVGERIMTSLGVFEISFLKPNGTNWDPIEMADSATRYPDLVFYLAPQGTSDPSRIILLDSEVPGAEFLENLTPDGLPFGFNLNQDGPSFVLTDELWDIVFLDDDGETADPELMLQGSFNPVFLANSFFVDDENGVLDITIGGFSVEIGFRIDIPVTQ